MLSKLLHFREPEPLGLDHARGLLDPIELCRRMGWGDVAVQACAGGTLSAGFVVQSSRGSLFLKTHLLGSGRAALLREARVLAQLYGGSLGVELLGDQPLSHGRIWLKMNVLEPKAPPCDPSAVIDLLANLDLDAVRTEFMSCAATEVFGVSTLLRMAHEARDVLLEHQLLSTSALECIDRAFIRLDRGLAEWAPEVCHGDLSPLNIMQQGAWPVVIDWEDSFLGVAHYDYLYWLSFHQNRRFYPDAPLRRLGLDPGLARALMVMIILLKCELAWRSGAWRHHALGFSERLLEVAVLH